MAANIAVAATAMVLTNANQVYSAMEGTVRVIPLCLRVNPAVLRNPETIRKAMKIPPKAPASEVMVASIPTVATMARPGTPIANMVPNSRRRSASIPV